MLALILAGMVLLVLNLQNLLFPIFASYGGQWARIRKGGAFGWGDLAFYPQSNLYPFDIILYIAALLVIFWFIRKCWKSREFKKIPRFYLYAGALPFAWAIIVFVTGFDYQNCNLPSQYFSCSNPTKRIVLRLATQAIIVLLTLAFMKIAANALNSKQKRVK